MGLIISISILALVIVVSILINNQIIAKKNQVTQAFSSIDVYLTKRFDLIPNLVTLLKQYLAHEKEVILQATEIRTKQAELSRQKDKIDNSNQLTKLMKKVDISLEQYPDLKADKQFIQLQFEITDIEEQLSAARRAYNAAVTSYNNKIQKFPASIIAGFRKDKPEVTLQANYND